MGFEGVLGSPVAVINNLNQYAQAFLPYNPTVVEIGAYEGAGTLGLASTYPYGRIFAAEPNPRAFGVLTERVQGCAHVVPVNVAFGSTNGSALLHVGQPSDSRASLLPLRSQTSASGEQTAVRVPVHTLDAWSADRGLTRAEFLRLDAGGFEFQILQGGRHILSTTLVIVVRTHLASARASVISYRTLKPFVEMTGFELLSHWYDEDGDGEATFVRKALYDSVFR